MRNGIKLVFLGLLILWGCQKGPDPYTLDIPEGWPSPVVPEWNPTTQQGVALGRALFYDPILSADSTVSCATCHRPELAFTDRRPRAVGVAGRTGRRSSMSLVNVGFAFHGLFWDGRAATLEEQSLHPVTDPLEMDNDWETVLGRIRDHAEYPRLFRAAFGTAPLDSMLIARALAQFERTLISKDSRYDRMVRGEINFTLAEQRGWTLFFDASRSVPHAECNHCHVDPLFANPTFHNNGLVDEDDESDESDLGREEVTANRYDRYKFKVPTLRNIALTAPYMHDGRLKTLEEVLDHYNSGGHPGVNVSPNVRKLGLNAQDKADLLAFLHSLTDTTFVKNPTLQNPFIKK